MRIPRLALAALLATFPAGAQEPSPKPKVAVMTPAQGPARPTLASYFARSESGMQTGGVRRIPIHTPKGDFTVWTKRFGHNPRIKLLLLHGGPGATHEYFE